MSLTIIETRNALAQVALPGLHERNKVESLFTKTIREQEEKNGSLCSENAQLEQRKIALELTQDQTPIEALESEIAQLQQSIEAARSQESTLISSIAHKQENSTRRVTEDEITRAIIETFRREGW